MGYGSMSYGGQTLPVMNGTAPNSSRPAPGMSNIEYSAEALRRMQRDEARRREQQKQDAAAALLNELFGGGQQGGQEQQGPGRGAWNGAVGDAPTGSEFGALNNSYKTRGSAPRYHEGIPMGGTPGVWAIRNDEIMHGPQEDAYWLTGDWKGRGGHRRYRGGR